MLWGEDKNLQHNAFWVIWSYSQIQASCTDPGGVWSRLKRREGEDGLALVSNIHAWTFHPVLACPLTDSRTRVQKQRVPATVKNRLGRQIMKFPSSEIREQCHRWKKSRFGAEREADSRGWCSSACLPQISRKLHKLTVFVRLVSPRLRATLCSPLSRKSCCWRKYSFIEVLINYR